jgi:hypothetical protein
MAGAPDDPDANSPDPSGARVDRALAVLDGLAEHMREIDGLRETLADLLVENGRLKQDNVRLSKALVAGGEGGAEMLQTVQTAQERARVRQQQVDDLLEENTDLQSRVLELEELNGSMMSMYVSSYQLHATLDLDEVVQTVEEILTNFLGAKSFAILMADDEETFHLAASGELGGRLPPKGIRPLGVLAEVLGSRTAYVHTSARPAREGILAAVPLAMGSTIVGAIVVYELLSQKERLLRNDVELLGLLGGHAASALISARLYARADRKLRTLEGMISLLGDAGDG